MSQHVQEQQGTSRVPLSAFVDVEQHRAVAARAQEEDRSISALVRRALDNYLACDHNKDAA
jgi:hypothetical protein